MVSIVEIPTSDFTRAKAFYQSILDIQIEVVDMDGITIGSFPNAPDGVAVQLINGAGYKPSANGTVIYLNGGEDLQSVAGKIEANGGKLIVTKTEIAPDMGFFALFTDTEGNRLGLHSYR